MKYKPAAFRCVQTKKTALPLPEDCAADFSVIHKLQIETTQRLAATILENSRITTTFFKFFSFCT